MSKRHTYKEYSTQELVRLYESAASEHGQANRRGDYRAGNPAADTIAAIYHEVRSHGLDHQRMLLPLLLSSDNGIRAWAAAHALEFEPRQGEAILLDIAKQHGVEGLDAEMTLKEWRKGTLRFP